MGLAAPRNRTKIANDPRNLAWSGNAATNSFGHRIMSAQGWNEGEALGSRISKNRSGLGSRDENANRLAAARVGVIFKDDTLGLGAKLVSKDAENQKTGMNAFAGLLDRLNARNAQEEVEVEKKAEEKKLERYAAGRWGGMMFVPGGLLVGDKEFGTKKEAREAEVKRAAEEAASTPSKTVRATGEEDANLVRAKRKEEKRKRKDERRVRREAKAARRAERAARKSTSQPQSTATSQSTSNNNSSDDDDNEPETSRTTSRSHSKSQKDKVATVVHSDSSASSDNQTESVARSKKRKRKSEAAAAPASEPPAAPTSRPTVIRNPRQLLRGRNIQAKRQAFLEARGLDGILMNAAA